LTSGRQRAIIARSYLIHLGAIDDSEEMLVTKQYLAHSASKSGRIDKVADHLKAVSERAAEYAAAFGAVGEHT
jgi:hypothetical protein